MFLFVNWSYVRWTVVGGHFKPFGFDEIQTAFFFKDRNRRNCFISHKQQSPEVFVYEKWFTPIVRLYLFMNVYCDLFVCNKMRSCVFLRAYNKILKRSHVQRVVYPRIVLPRGGGNVTGGIGNESFFPSGRWISRRTELGSRDALPVTWCY